MCLIDFKKNNCLFAYLGHVSLLAISFVEFCQMYSSTIHQKARKYLFFSLEILGKI
jgi:hypothetical protein